MSNQIESGSKVIILSNNCKGVVSAILCYADGKRFAEVRENSGKKYQFYDVNNLALDMDIDINKPIL